MAFVAKLRRYKALAWAFAGAFLLTAAAAPQNPPQVQTSPTTVILIPKQPEEPPTDAKTSKSSLAVSKMTRESKPTTPRPGSPDPATPVVKEPGSEASGTADFAVRGYYMAGTGQDAVHTSGVSFDLHEFIPKVGLIEAKVEAFDSQSSFQTGDMYAQLSGVAWANRHWTFTAGDFRAPNDLVGNPFLNIYNPDVNARGARIEAKQDNRTLTFYVGESSLLQGPRLPFRMILPQQIVSGSWQERIGERLGIALRGTAFWTDLNSGSTKSLVAIGHAYDTAQVLSAQSLFKVRKHLSLYGEASYSRVAATPGRPDPQPFSFYGGPVFESKKLTLRANYVYQSAAYLPLLGYAAGDRRGAFGDVTFRPFRWLDLHASASKYENNLNRDPQTPAFSSPTLSGGVAIQLPLKISAMADYSQTRLNATGPGTDTLYPMRNRQANFSLSRTLFRHTLRASLLEMQLKNPADQQRQRYLEFEDAFAFRRLTFAGSVRHQEMLGSTIKSSLFYRVSTTLSLRRVSLFAQAQWGNDLANKTLFATSSYNSTSFGGSANLAREWQLSGEIFRNTLNSALNPGSIFALQNNGAPLPATLTGFNQWSVYFQLSRRFRWGSAMQTDAYGSPIQQVPLLGSVSGMVQAVSSLGDRPAAGIPISLDHRLIALTDERGYYVFQNVPEGFHDVGLAITELPSDVDAGDHTGERVRVAPKSIVRVDMNVVPLANLQGKIEAPAKVDVEAIVIRLLPGNRYTTPDKDGNFAFFNIPAGNYTAVLDGKTLPEETALASDASQAVSLDPSLPPPFVTYRIVPDKPQKPTKVILEEKRVEPPPKPPAQHKPRR